jgi:hypothetical protein
VGFLGCVGDVARVVWFLDVVDLVVDGGGGEGGEFLEAFLSV